MIKRGPLVLALIVFLCVFIAWAPAVLWASGVEPFERRVEGFTLKNGLQVLMLKRSISPTVSLYIRYRSGAVDEGDGQTGIAHLLEHMMFKGTRTIGSRDVQKESVLIEQIARTGEAIDTEVDKGSRGNGDKLLSLKERMKALQEEHKTLFISNEIDRLYSENGAVGLNASTGQDLTTYHVSLPANRIELWARIESDRMENPVFREFYQERDVVLEERRQRIEASPDGKLYEAFLGAAFVAHPYRRPVIGWASDIRHLTMKDLDVFIKRHHAPNNTVIAVVGDFDPPTVRRMIEKYFGTMAGRNHTLPSRITEEPAPSGERRVTVHVDANPQFIMGYHKPPPPSQDDYVFDVIEAILSRGRTSRFYKTLVEERGLAEDVQATNGTPGARYPNLFAIFATPRHPHGNQVLEAAIDEMIETVKKDPVGEKELQKIKNQVRADFVRRQASNEGLATMLSYFQVLLGDYRYITNYADVIDKITADDIMRVSRTYLVKDKRTIATIVKE
jgi:predicted Zn-dependent peptidase